MSNIHLADSDVDNSTLQIVARVLSVKALGIAAAQLANNIDASAKGFNAAQLEGNAAAAFAAASHAHAGADISSGTIDNARFSAYSDLGAEGYLDNNADGDILTRVQADGRFAALRDVLVSAYVGAAQSLTGGGGTVTAQFNTEDYDVGADYDTGTFQFTAAEAMKVRVTVQLAFTVRTPPGAWSAGAAVRGYLSKNGSTSVGVAMKQCHSGTTYDTQIISICRDVLLAATDTLEVKVASDDNANLAAGTYYSYICIERID